ncbi:MAG: TetR/AcrR family transcriptional regulator, partial [Dehalococcoidia bacterium]
VLSEPWAPEIAKRLRAARRLGRREVERVFERELERCGPVERHHLLEALTVAASWSSWEALRTHQQLTPKDARRVVARTLRALLKEA